MNRLEAQLRLQPEAVGDVLDHGHGELWGAVPVTHQRRRELGPHQVTVLVAVALLHPCQVAAPLDDLAIGLPHACGVVRVDEVRHGQPAELLDRVAEHGREGLVGLDDLPVEVGDADPDRGIGEDRAEPGLADQQRLLGLAPGLGLGPADGLLLVQDPAPGGIDVAVEQGTQHERGGVLGVRQTVRPGEGGQVAGQGGRGGRDHDLGDQPLPDHAPTHAAGGLEIGRLGRDGAGQLVGCGAQQDPEFARRHRQVDSARQSLGPG
ncbi:MAG: hypothetical protein U0Q19_03465 [Kineosporiaceae bacterium]